LDSSAEDLSAECIDGYSSDGETAIMADALITEKDLIREIEKDLRYADQDDGTSVKTVFFIPVPDCLTRPYFAVSSGSLRSIPRWH
jgi:hypothetical protein